MEQVEQKINWFPGHMKKATDQIKKILKTVDVVIEVVDARAVNLTSNWQLQALVNSKPILQIALKNDLAKPEEVTAKTNFVYANKFDRQLVKKVLQKLEIITAAKTANFQRKGLMSIHYQVMVIGLPNVGKSTLINCLINKKQIRVENRPGVTKNVTRVKLNEKFSLLDTPGILFKRIDDFATGAKLVLMGIIKPEVTPFHAVMTFAYNYFKVNYLALLNHAYQVNGNDDYEIFLTKIAAKRKFMLKHDIYDLQRAEQSFYHDVVNGKLGKISFEHES